MCFAPQQRALFRHRNFQKWSEHVVLCTCWLGNACFAPQRRALFRHRNFQKWSDMWCFVHFDLEMRASRHNCVQFVISYLARWLRTAALARPLFDPPGPQIIGKTQCFATFLPFRAPASSFFWFLVFSGLLSSALLSSTLLFSLTLPISAFHLSVVSEVWLLNFLRW